ncbi:EI24 domain-containing protein [Helicobacter sp.]|uniref:EI24 domain-containing protein n=1 Tax=Helicobacter sp. TaxID=218 RepID=UPI0025C347C2|nr:EI24 domain-containing protein [Helicobacter sp.]MBR2494229.1 EI24 domain-containing protein [Helicobacter sp.]
MDSTQGFLAILHKSKKDFFSFPMIILNIAPIALGLAIWGGILYAFSDILITYVKELLPESWQAYIQANGNILAQGVTISLYVLLGFCVILLALVGNVFVSIFYTPLAVAYIRKHHYPQISKLTSLPLTVTLRQFTKAFVLLCALCMFCVPVLFIPIIGGAIMLVPFFVFFYQTMLFDIGHEVLGVEQYGKLQAAKRKYTTTLLTYLLGLIPILNFFTPLLQVIILSHYCFHIAMQSSVTHTSPAP